MDGIDTVELIRTLGFTSVSARRKVPARGIYLVSGLRLLADGLV